MPSSELPRHLKTGDVVGVALNQSDFPVSLRFWFNGTLVKEIIGPSTDSTPILQLKTADAAVAVNFGATDFAHDPPNGYLGLIKSRSIL